MDACGATRGVADRPLLVASCGKGMEQPHTQPHGLGGEECVRNVSASALAGELWIRYVLQSILRFPWIVKDVKAVLADVQHTPLLSEANVGRVQLFKQIKDNLTLANITRAGTPQAGCFALEPCFIEVYISYRWYKRIAMT